MRVIALEVTVAAGAGPGTVQEDHRLSLAFVKVMNTVAVGAIRILTFQKATLHCHAQRSRGRLDREIRVGFTEQHGAHVVGEGNGVIRHVGLAGQYVQVVGQQLAALANTATARGLQHLAG